MKNNVMFKSKFIYYVALLLLYIKLYSIYVSANEQTINKLDRIFEQRIAELTGQIGNNCYFYYQR